MKKRSHQATVGPLYLAQPLNRRAATVISLHRAPRAVRKASASAHQAPCRVQCRHSASLLESSRATESHPVLPRPLFNNLMRGVSPRLRQRGPFVTDPHYSLLLVANLRHQRHLTDSATNILSPSLQSLHPRPECQIRMQLQQ